MSIGMSIGNKKAPKMMENGAFSNTYCNSSSTYYYIASFVICQVFVIKLLLNETTMLPRLQLNDTH